MKSFATIRRFTQRALIVLSFFGMAEMGWGQTANGFLNFGTTANGTTASTANTGFGGVRVGTGGGGFTIQNSGQSIGSDGELRGIAPTSASVNSVGITSTEYGTAATTFTISFELHLSGGSSGTWYFFAGNDATIFGSAQSSAFSGATTFTGIRWAFGASSAITTNNRAGGNWSVTGLSTPFAQSTAYYVTIIGNNSASSVSYGASNAYSVAANTYDLWVNGSLAGNDLAKAQLAASTNINAFRFYGESSTSNVATIALDNIRWYNTCTLPPTHLALVSVPTTGTVGSNLTSFTTEARSGSSTGPVANSFTGAITVAKVSGAGSISGTTAPNATAGVTTYSNIQFSSADTYTINATAAAPIVNAATSGNIVVSSASTTISTSGTLSAVNTTYGTASASPTSFTVSGSNLNGTAAVTVTPPAGFEVATSSDFSTTIGTSASALSLGTATSISSTTIYVRLSATASVSGSPYSGNIVVVGGGATSQNVATVSSTISKKALTITAGNQSVEFGTAVATVTGNGSYSPTGFVNSETSSVIGGSASYTTTYTTTTAAGSNVATITPVITSLTATNYSFTAANGNITVTATTPSAPTITSITPGNALLSVAFTAPSSNGGASITNYEYSINNGSLFTACSPLQTASPIIINGLTNGTIYDVQIRAVNSAGSGTASTAVQGTPTAPTTPTIFGAATATAFTTTYGTASADQSFTISGSALEADIIATAPTGFEVSSDGTNYGTTATFTQSSGTASGTLRIRLKVGATVTGTNYNSVTIQLTSTNATTVNITTASSGNSVATKALTIIGISISNKIYDANTTATILGTAIYSGLVSGDNSIVNDSPTAVFANKTVANAKAVTVSGYTAPSANYSISQPTGLTANITAAPLTLTSASVTSRTYNGTTVATITGTLSGIIPSDVVTLNGTGTFASANSGTGISVTSTSTLGGADAGNYALTQPMGLTGDITKANQTITFNALVNQTIGAADYSPGATSATSGTNAITYTSSNTAVATIVSSQIHIVGAGTTTITASQAGDGNYNAAADVSQTLTVNAFSSTSDYFRTAASGTWGTSSIWESSVDGSSNWITATLSPTSAANTITIRNGHSITISTSVSIDQVIVQSGGILTLGTGGVATIANGSGDDITVQNGGRINYQLAPTFNTSSTIRINGGGILSIEVSGVTGNGVGVNASTHIYDDASILQWNLVTTNPSSSGVTFFPNVTTEIPILRFASGTNSVWGANTATTVNGKVEIASGVTVSLGGTASKTFKYGITGEGILNQLSSGQIIFSGSSSEIGGAVALNLGTNGLSVTGNLAVTGTLDCSTYSVSGAGAFTLSSGATLKTSHTGGLGSAIAVTGTKTFSAGANYVFSGTTTTPFPASPQSIGNPASVTIDAAVTLNRDIATTSLIVNSTKTLTLSTAADLTVSGNISNAGTISIADGGSLLQTGSGSDSNVNTGGTYKVYKTLAATTSAQIQGNPTRYWYIGSPVSGETAASDVFGNSGTPKLWLHNSSASTQWQQIFGDGYSGGSVTMTSGRGYLFRSTSAANVVFDQQNINNGTITLSGIVNTTPGSAGYNLISNPYPSTLNWTQFRAANPNLASTYWVRTFDPQLNAGNGMKYSAYNANGGQSVNGSTTNEYIAPMQAFWVYAPAVTTSVTFNNGMRSHGTSTLHTLENTARVRFHLTNGTYTDEALVYVNEDAQNTNDTYDSDKIIVASTAYQIYCLEGTKRLSIDGIQNALVKDTVQVGVQIPLAATYTINATEIGIDEDVFLEDKITGAYQNLKTTPSYSFTSVAGTFNNRFVLHFAPFVPALPGQTAATAIAMPTSNWPQCNNVSTEDQWHAFTATSEGISIEVNTSTTDVVIELQDGTGNVVAQENAVNGIGNETLNFFGLTAGQTYKVGVRNNNSALGTGIYGICVKSLKRGGCDYGAGPYSLCQYYKATWAGSTGVSYTFTFTGTSGPAAGQTFTRTQNSDICVLSTVTPLLPYGSTYDVTISNTYTLTDGAGNTEQVTVPSIGGGCQVVTIAQPQTTLSASSSCNNGARFRGAVVSSMPWVCGANNWRWRFTEVNPLTLQTVGLPIELNRGTASNYLSLASVAQLQNGKTYAVETAPMFAYTGTNYNWGPTQYLCIVGASQGALQDAEQGVAQGQNKDAMQGPSEGASQENDVLIYATTGQQIKVWTNIDNAELTNATVRIYNSTGSLVYTQRMSSNEMIIDLNTAAGLYIVEVGEVKRKVVISPLAP